MGLSLSAALAFAVTVVLTLTVRPLALRLHIIDKPDGRKHHVGEIPLVDGIAMFIGILVAMLAAVQTTSRWTLLFPTSRQFQRFSRENGASPLSQVTYRCANFLNLD